MTELDPRKFTNDMLDESPEPTDDEVFESLYELGLSIHERNTSEYPKWVAWLQENHPDDENDRTAKD